MDEEVVEESAERELRQVIQEVLVAANVANATNAFVVHTAHAFGKTGYIVLAQERARDVLKQYLGGVIGLTCCDVVWVLLHVDAAKVIAAWGGRKCS